MAESNKMKDMPVNKLMIQMCVEKNRTRPL